MDFPNNLVVAKAYTRRDIFVEHPHPVVKKPETIDPRETFPVLAGTVMARATDSKMLIRYADGGLNGADVAIGMLYDEARQPGKVLELGAPNQALPGDLVIHGIAINATNIANLTATARVQLAAMGVYTYVE